ncbi:GntR family transcriptional regulator [Variovorax sp. GB1P17]|uniref:GntR family transcriptional regulator n=1 Tax=Variovorax sp. GB1P17 TaxID=3443740 RepID=UPI003F45D858
MARPDGNPPQQAATALGGFAARRHQTREPSLTQQAYERIKSSILSLELRPGLFLNEADLCELTGFGRMPVHQAIHRLQADGLVEVIPRKGLLIRADSLQDIMTLLEARLAIEPNIVALAAQRIKPDQVAELRKLLKQSASLLNQSQRKAFSVLDRVFHSVVAEAAGNKILSDMLRPLHERSDLMWHLRIMPADGLEVTQREHEAVLQAVADQDPEAAWRAMKAHLASLHDRIVRASGG